MSNNKQEKRVFAVADVVPEISREVFTAGKEYAAIGGNDFGFDAVGDDGMTHSMLWHGCAWLNGGNWRRVERETEAGIAGLQEFNALGPADLAAHQGSAMSPLDLARDTGTICTGRIAEPTDRLIAFNTTENGTPTEILRLTAEGMYYRGELVPDAGEAHRAFLETMRLMQEGMVPQPASIVVAMPTEEWARKYAAENLEPKASKADKCYSFDGETFMGELHDAVQEAAGDMLGDDPITGKVVTIHEGDTVRHNVADWIPNIVDQLSEHAYDDAGEYAQGWPDCTPDQDKELQAAICKAVDEWLDRHNLRPTFHAVENVREIKVRITSEDGDFEVVDETAQAEGGAV